MALYFITGNRNKFSEVRAIIPDVMQLDINVQEIQSIDAKEVVRAKLLEASKHVGGEFIVEDTSLYLDCMNGLPGPLIKWFMKTVGNDGLFGIANGFNNTRAEAKTIIGYARNAKEIYYFEGSIKGEIIAPKGVSGFGWDPIFQPDGYCKSFAEFSEEEKNSMSMRYIAINKLKDFMSRDKKIEPDLG